MGIRLGGRAKGTPNKVTADVRQLILTAVADLGGHARLVAWAKEDPANERVFWGTLMPKVLPKAIHLGGQEDNPPAIGIRVSFVDTQSGTTSSS